MMYSNTEQFKLLCEDYNSGAIDENDLDEAEERFQAAVDARAEADRENQ